MPRARTLDLAIRAPLATLAALAALAAVATLGCSFIVGVSGDPVVVADGDAADAALAPDTLDAAPAVPDPDADAVDAAGDAPDDAPAE